MAGDCFEAHAEAMVGNFYGVVGENATLCHGLVHPTDGPVKDILHGHAWLEVGDTVFDLSNGRSMAVPKDVYYTIGRIEADKVIRYTREECIDNVLKYGHYGPWDEYMEQGEYA